MQKIGLTLILGILFFSLEIYSQSANDSKPKLQRLDKIIKQDGWEIPDLSKEKSLDVSESNGTLIKRFLYIQKAPLQKFEYYYWDEKDKSLKVFSRDCNLRHSESYSIKGKIYAYRFDCVPISYGDILNEKGEIIGQTMQSTGIILSYSLFDEDGDGKFETKYLHVKMPDTIPDWAKKQ